ncbi:hypothetical protein [Ruminococcus sp. HUN007]|uniref:hypothetical protein n=1 Tax=Ruminococcus sp. HUN007 TaxID=1514668 RepID=UPI0005D2B6F1|nr:hypothetical protein [Ruminococcus sp. HUN007]
MEPEIKKITTNYDGIAKSLLDSMKDESLVAFINSSFSKDFKKDAKVVRLATETYDEELKQKRCDYFIRIENDLFLIEIQSNGDSEMAMRIFDYGIRGAKIHGSVKNDEIIDLKLPEPVVFFLRKRNNPKEKLSVRISGPHENDSFTYEARVIYLDDYSFKDMIDRSMFPMIPFYMMRYEKKLFDQHTVKDETAILTDLRKCSEQLKEAYRNNRIGREIYKYIRDWLVSVFRTIVRKAEEKRTFIDLEEAEEIMQMIMDEPIEGYDIFQTIRESKMEGRMEGRIEGKIEAQTEVALNMLKNNIPDDLILNCSGISTETLEKLKKQITEK